MRVSGPMDPYMGTGYRNQASRDKRDQANARTVKGFVVPGSPVPVDAAPPPTVPPSGVGAAAGGAAGSAAVPLAMVGATFVGGVALGWWASQPVRDFKRKTRDQYAWSKQKSPWMLAQGEGYDWKEAFEAWLDPYKYRFGSPQYAQGGFIPPIDYTGFVDSTGFHGPIYRNNGLYHYFIVEQECAGVARTHWQSGNSIDYDLSGDCFAGPTAGWTEGTVSSPGCGSNPLTGISNRVGSPMWVCPSNESIFPFEVVGGVQTAPSRFRTSVKFLLQQQATPLPDVAGALVEAGTQAVVAPGANLWLDSLVEVRPWADAVAPPGTQPRGHEYVAPPQHGYVVPLPLSAPFGRLVNHGRVGAVTVPDQEIDPSTGTVTVVPPGHPPDFPSPSEEFEKKPDSLVKRMIGYGFTFVNVVTETQDFMEAMMMGLPKSVRDALKKKRRGGKKGQLKSKGDIPPWLIMEAIVEHWDEFEADRALEAYINNEIEDRIYGRVFGAIGKVQKRIGGAGLRRAAATWHPVQVEVPEIHFADGEYSVEIGSVTIGG